jgi:hypothetical protein
MVMLDVHYYIIKKPSYLSACLTCFRYYYSLKVCENKFFTTDAKLDMTFKNGGSMVEQSVAGILTLRVMRSGPLKIHEVGKYMFRRLISRMRCGKNAML